MTDTTEAMRAALRRALLYIDMSENPDRDLFEMMEVGKEARQLVKAALALPQAALSQFASREVPEGVPLAAMFDFHKWLLLPHKVDTSTKQRSDYWANQFRIACERARKIWKDNRSAAPAAEQEIK